MKPIIFIFFFSAFLSCVDSDFKESKSDNALIDSVYATMSRAYKNYDITLIEKIYDKNAYTIYCGDTSEIKHFTPASFQRTFDYHNERKLALNMKFKILHRKIDKTIAYDVGYFQIDKTDRAGVTTMGKPGKFTTILSKQEDGSWKFVVDIYGDAPVKIFDRHYVD
jgi:ketosteroid isomerase-like protein